MNRVLTNIQELVMKNETLKKQEVKYKEECREEMAKMQQQIRYVKFTALPTNRISGHLPTHRLAAVCTAPLSFD